MKAREKQLKAQTQKLNEWPGVYVMYDAQGNKLYIGKSVNLRQRVSSYWQKSSGRSKKMKRMVHLVETFQVYYTDTELDALLLESAWITQFKPPYNTALTREDRAVYLDIHEKPAYAIRMSRKETTTASKRFGPFRHKQLVRPAYSYFMQNYPHFFCQYRTKKLTASQCPSFQTKCPKACEGNQEGLADLFEKEVFLEGEALHKKMEEEIEKLSEEWAFEEAGKRYEQLKGLKYMHHVVHFTQEMKQWVYIGRLPTKEALIYKYYLVIKGEVKGMRVGYLSQEATILGELRQVAKDIKNQETTSIKTYQLLILNRFRKDKMTLFDV